MWIKTENLTLKIKCKINVAWRVFEKNVKTLVAWNFINNNVDYAISTSCSAPGTLDTR